MPSTNGSRNHLNSNTPLLSLQLTTVIDLISLTGDRPTLSGSSHRNLQVQLHPFISNTAMTLLVV